jgi:hypothetical protein
MGHCRTICLHTQVPNEMRQPKICDASVCRRDLLRPVCLLFAFRISMHSPVSQGRIGMHSPVSQGHASQPKKEIKTTKRIRRRKDSASDTAPFRRSKRRRDHRALGSTLGSPSDPQDLGVREGAIGEDGQSKASPIDARSLSPIPADGALAKLAVHAHTCQVRRLCTRLCTHKRAHRAREYSTMTVLVELSGGPF